MFFKIMKRKLLPTLLTIIMIVTLVPATAFAAEPPTLVSAEVTNGGGVGLTFSKEMSPTDLVNKIKAGFTITGWDGSIKTITDVSLHSASGGTNNFVQLYLDPTINGGDTPRLKYTPSDVQSLDGAMLAEIVSMNITNYSAHPTLDTTTPLAVMLDSTYSHTFTATGGTGPYSFYVDEGSLPTGLSLNTSTGEISGTPTTAGNFSFTIMVVDAVSAFDRKEFNITVNAPMDAVCEINGTEYTTLEEALGDVLAGETKTIRLLKNIYYNKGITLDNQKITFDLNGCTLNVVNSDSNSAGLNVYNGACVTLLGTGDLNVTGTSYGVRVASNTVLSSATVTNATATGMEGTAAYAYSRASLTVLGNAEATGISSMGAHALATALIDIKGDVIAANQGACASSATIKVAGNVLAMGTDIIGNASGIGANAYDGAIQIGGDVTASRVGAMAHADGNITIDGILTAPSYIELWDDVMTGINNYLPETTKEGYRTYQIEGNTVWVKDKIPTATYVLTVQKGAGSGSYEQGATVTITAATAQEGQRFKEWSITPSIIFAGSTNKSSQTAKFTMPAQAVTATAIYELIPSTNYIVTFNLNGGTRIGGGELIQSVPDGGSAIAPTVSRNNYTFTSWDKAFTNVTQNMTVSATWSYYNGSGNGGGAPNGGGGNSDNSSNRGNGNDTPAPTTMEKRPVLPVIALIPITANAKTNGTAKAIVPDKSIPDAISKAQEDAKAQGKTVNSISAVLDITKPKKATALTLVLTQNSLQSLINAGVSSFELKSALVSLSFDLKALQELQKQSSGDITFSFVPVQNLSGKAKTLIGNRPVYNITISYVRDRKTVNITSLENGTSTLSIFYKPGKKEVVDNLFGVYVNKKGKASRIRGSVYDTKSKSIIFTINRFLVYGVGYEKGTKN